MVPILHDKDKYWTIWAETFRIHTYFRGDSNGNTPEGPRPLICLKQHLRFLIFCIYFWAKIRRKSKKSGMVFESNKGSGAFRSASIGIVSKNEYERGKFQPIQSNICPYRKKITPKTNPGPNFGVGPPPILGGPPPILGSHSMGGSPILF